MCKNSDFVVWSGYPPVFHLARFFFEWFYDAKIREKRQISRIFQVWVCLMVEWILNVYQSNGFIILYNRVKIFFKWLNNFGDMWIFSFLKWAKSEKFAKNRRVLKCRLPICVYENGHWYQCVALCEYVWMHCVDFLILDLLKRYRQNTAENRALLWSLMYILNSAQTDILLYTIG